MYFLISLGISLYSNMLESFVHVSTLVRDSVVVTYVYHTCSFFFIGLHNWVDLIILHILDFYIIMGMT